jgi:hypothetical protein
MKKKSTKIILKKNKKIIKKIMWRNTVVIQCFKEKK